MERGKKIKDLQGAAGEDNGGAGPSEGSGIVFVNPLAQSCHCKCDSFYKFLFLLKVNGGCVTSRL